MQSIEHTDQLSNWRRGTDKQLGKAAVEPVTEMLEPKVACHRGVSHLSNWFAFGAAILRPDHCGDTLVIFPHDVCPVDGVVIEGRGVIDESYLTGKPFQITKTLGSSVISGAINGDSTVTIRATQLAADSRYAKIMGVMRESESKRPQLQRLGDRLGAIYTPVALGIAGLAWAIIVRSPIVLEQSPEEKFAIVGKKRLTRRRCTWETASMTHISRRMRTIALQSAVGGKSSQSDA